MNIQNISLGDIHPYARNPRKNDEAVKNVAASIREFGFLVSLVIDRNHKIVAGHTRYMFTANVRELNVITVASSKSQHLLNGRTATTPCYSKDISENPRFYMELEP